MNEKKSFVIGLDGGGTKTAAELCSLEGTVRAKAQGGPSNFQVIGVEQAAKTILDLVETCCDTAGCGTSAVAAVVAGLTGAGRPVDQQRMAVALKRMATAKRMGIPRFAVESDARIALEGAFSGAPGVIVIAGTGSIVFGKDEKGRIHRAGGWGRLIGDEGSGYWIGTEAFRAVARMLDGRIKKTTLARIFTQRLGFGTQESIITALYKEGFDIASVVPGVVEAAEKGDRIAGGILTKAAEDLVDVIQIALIRLHATGRQSGKTAVSFAGSLITRENLYSRKVKGLIRKRLPRVLLRQPEANPVHGAALIALAVSQKHSKE
ncbi:MAG: BadF/BadG/BcrA/BcrD ATPase family protein [Bacteroidota bacterium]